MCLLLITSCKPTNNQSSADQVKAKESDSQSSESLATQLGGHTWCLDPSFTVYLENDLNSSDPLTTKVAFAIDGSVSLSYVSIQSGEVRESYAGQWSATQETLTFQISGSTSSAPAFITDEGVLSVLMEDPSLPKEQWAIEEYQICL